MGRVAVRGFTLIEVVVAFVLLTLVFAVGFQIFAAGLARAGALEERSNALEVARSRLADAGAEEPLAPGQDQGQTEDGLLHWTTVVTPWDQAGDPAHPIPSPYALYRVEVKVDWHGSDGKDHSLALARLGLGARQ